MKKFRQKNIFYSVIIPVFNEQKNVLSLSGEIIQEMDGLNKNFEVIFVDDGSNDKTFEELVKIKGIKIIKLRTNLGQSTALNVGINYSTGKIILTTDGDGQNDPKDFKNLLNKLDHGFDVVCGWRHKRKDSFSKRFISKGAVFLRKFLVDDGIHDSGCTLRAYRRECFDDLNIYGEMHRMLPALLRWRGFKITEVKVNHRPRIHGQSKYNWRRIIKGFLDMIYIWFWRKYSSRPLHLFGGLGFLFVISGSTLLLILIYLRFVYEYSLSDKIWPLFSFILILIGIQLFVTGLLASGSLEKEKIKSYQIEEIIDSN